MPLTSEPPRAGSLLYLTVICLVAALGGMLFGYDTGVINGAIGPLKAHFKLDAVATGWAEGWARIGWRCARSTAFSPSSPASGTRA